MLSNILAQFMQKLSNTEDELKKYLLIKRLVLVFREYNFTEVCNYFSGSSTLHDWIKSLCFVKDELGTALTVKCFWNTFQKVEEHS